MDFDDQYASYEIRGKPTLTQEEETFLKVLALYGTVRIGTYQYEAEDVPVSPLVLNMFLRETIYFEDELLVFAHSTLGLENATLENLAVVGGGLYTINGAGSRTASEWWEKKKGTDVIFLSINNINFVLMCVGGEWHLRIVNVFLPEGAEYKDNVLWIRSNCDTPIEIQGQCYETRVVEKCNFDTPIPEDIEGIIITIDSRLYKLNTSQTITLLVKDQNGQKVAVSKEDKIIFNVECPLGLHEFTMEGKFIRAREDKVFPDSSLRIAAAKKLPVLKDLRKLLKLVSTDCDPYYIPTQWIGYEHFPKDYNSINVCENVFQQRFTLDQNPNVELYKARGKIRVDIQDFINEVTQYFEFTKYYKALCRSGISFVLEEVRSELIKRGICPYYNHWRVFNKGLVGDVKFKESPVIHPKHEWYMMNEPRLGECDRHRLRIGFYPFSADIWKRKRLNIALEGGDFIREKFSISCVSLTWYPCSNNEKNIYQWCAREVLLGATNSDNEAGLIKEMRLRLIPIASHVLRWMVLGLVSGRADIEGLDRKHLSAARANLFHIALDISREDPNVWEDQM